ncbi:hypothetical protein OIV83_003015 [Microbotryomycetes sp. JL201]|nr:hypothetical protein OIV83_003015 [Microbotryomycetes sp. JL201]
MSNMPPSILLLILLATSLLVAAESPSKPVALPFGPRSTPSVNVPRPTLMPYEAVQNILSKDKGHAHTQEVDGTTPGLPDDINSLKVDHNERGLMEERAASMKDEGTLGMSLNRRQTGTTCVGSWANDTYISTLFYYGGTGYTVSLCPGAQIPMDNAAFFYWPNQTLTTQGNPTDATRAQLYIRNTNISCLVYGGLDNTHYTKIQNIILDGGRPALGQLFNVPATISIGGNNIGQTVQNVKVFEPRGWNGSIVIFGAPGSRVASNQIIARTRQALGGINMVDYNPFGGSYAGVTVTANTITSDTQFIKVGIAIGTLSWGTDNRTIARPSGGTVSNNILQSGLTGYFGYGISISGMNLTTVTGNKATKAKFGGTYTSSCFQSIAPLPPFQAFVQDKYTTPTCKIDNNFVKTNNVVFPICIGPK